MDLAVLAHVTLSHHIRTIVNEADSCGRSPLYCAAKMKYYDDYIKVLRILLEFGARVNAYTESDNDPFLAVLANGDVSAVELMIEHGIDLIDYKNKCPLHMAAVNPRLEVLEFLLCTEIFDLEQEDSEGRTVLSKAVSVNNLAAVELLLERGAQVKPGGKMGHSPLRFVMFQDVADDVTRCIQILLQHGADPDGAAKEATSFLACVTDSEHRSIYTARLRLLLERGAGRDLHGAFRTAFENVVEFGDLQAVQLFFEYGFGQVNYGSESPLHKAVVNPRTEILEFLLREGYFNPKDRISETTALAAAVGANNPGAVELLINYGAGVDDVDDTYDDDEMGTLLHYVDYKNESDETTRCIEILLRHGAYTDMYKDGYDALGLFAATSKYSPLYIDRLEMFLKHWSVEDLGDSFYEAFGVIVEHGELEDVQQFLAKHPDILSKDKKHSLLHNAVDNPRREILEFLLSTCKLDPEWRDVIGCNALHKAASVDNYEAMEMLLDWGVDVDSSTEWGETALITVLHRFMDGMIDSRTNKQYIKLLLNRGAKVCFRRRGGIVDLLFRDGTNHLVLFPCSASKLQYIREIRMLFVRHASLMASQGQYHRQGLINHVEMKPELEVDIQRCFAELETLKAEILGGLVTLYDVLAYENFYKEESDVMQKLHNPEYIRTLEERFPFYGDRLIEIIGDMKTREAAAEELGQLMDLDRDTFHKIIEKIVRMLPRWSVQALSEVKFDI